MSEVDINTLLQTTVSSPFPIREVGLMVGLIREESHLICPLAGTIGKWEDVTSKSMILFGYVCVFFFFKKNTA